MGNSGSAHARGGKWLELVIRCAYFAVSMFVCLSNANVIKFVSERELKKMCLRHWIPAVSVVAFG